MRMSRTRSRSICNASRQPSGHRVLTDPGQRTDSAGYGFLPDRIAETHRAMLLLLVVRVVHVIGQLRRISLRVTGPLLLGLALLAVRDRVKR